jgi:hypothetical protein
MFNQNTLQHHSYNPGIWTLLFISVAALGIYYSFILVIRDRGKGRQRFMMGLYTLSASLLLLHFLAALYGDRFKSGWLQMTGTVALFLIGPFSYRMVIDRPGHPGLIRLLFTLIPASIILGILLLDLMDEPALYVTGVAYTGVCLVLQAFRLRPGNSISGSISWKTWYTAIQIFLLTGIGISSLFLSELLVVLFASAGLAILILLTWLRLLHIAYLSYVISRS